MDAENAPATSGDSFQTQKPNPETTPPRPIITPREARRVLGSEYKNLSDDDLYRVIIEMERLAVLLANNPEIFNLTNGEKDNE